MGLFSGHRTLSFEEYSALLQEFALAEFYRLYSEPEVNWALFLQDSNRDRYGVELMCACMFLLGDTLRRGAMPADVTVELLEKVSAGLWAQVGRKVDTGETEAEYRACCDSRLPRYRACWNGQWEDLSRIANHVVFSCCQYADEGDEAKAAVVAGMLRTVLISYRVIIHRTKLRFRRDEVLFCVRR